MKTLGDLNLNSKKVLIRADLNVPLDDKGHIADDLRIRAAMETIRYCAEHQAGVIVCSHLGRPKGEPKPEFSLRRVAQRMQELTSLPVSFCAESVGNEASRAAEVLKPGEILVLENLRFNPGEKTCSEDFSKKLSELSDIFVNDAFGTAHRKHASTYGVPKIISEKAVGLLMQKEVETLGSLFANPARPLIVTLGGSKISTKIKLIKSLSSISDKILIGGGMANTFFKAKGYEVGKSLVEEEELSSAKELMLENVLLPVDVFVAKEFKNGSESRVCSPNDVKPDEMIVDVGPETTRTFGNYAKKAGTCVWNGPLGAFEISDFSRGTGDFALSFAASNAKTLVGGGDTNLALSQSGVLDKVNYVSTGGGAFLKFLEDKTLPTLEVLT